MFSQLLLNGIAAGSVCSILAVGLGLAYRTCAVVDFAQAGICAVAAYLAFTAAAWLDMPSVLSGGLGVVSAGLLATIYHGTILTPLRHREAVQSVSLLASLGVFIVLEALLLMVFGAEAKVFPRVTTVEAVRIPGGRLTVIQIVSILVALGVVTTWSVVIWLTRFGLVWRALASNKEVAETVGIPTDVTSRLAFVAASLTSGIAGVLKAYDTGLEPSMGFGLLLVALVAVVIGGNSVAANAVIALVLSVLQQTVVLIVPTHWQDAVVFLVLGVFLLLSPTGVFGRPLRKVGV